MLTPFQRLVLRSLAILVRAAIGSNPFGTASDWNKDAHALVSDLSREDL